MKWLRNTWCVKVSVVFFEEINQTLTDWNVLSKCNRILMSLPVNLTHLLYSANVPPPFDKKDARIKKIPLNVFWVKHLWARGYLAVRSGTVTDEMIREYIEEQEGEPINDESRFQIDNP